MILPSGIRALVFIPFSIAPYPPTTQCIFHYKICNVYMRLCMWSVDFNCGLSHFPSALSHCVAVPFSLGHNHGWPRITLKSTSPSGFPKPALMMGCGGTAWANAAEVCMHWQALTQFGLNEFNVIEAWSNAPFLLNVWSQTSHQNIDLEI